MISVDHIFVIATKASDATTIQAKLDAVPITQNVPVTIREVRKDLKLSFHKNWSGSNSDEQDHEMARAAAHASVWIDAFQRGLNNVLILEDEFKPVAKHYGVLVTDYPWELLYLGRKAKGGDAVLDESGLVIPGLSDGAFAYLLNASALAKLGAQVFSDGIVPVDDFLAIAQGTYPDSQWRDVFSIRLNALAPMSNLIGIENNKKESDVNAGVYQPLFPALFDFENDEHRWVKDYLDPQLVAREFDLMCDEPIDNVFAFPLFTNKFCREIIEEAENYGKWVNYRQKDGEPIDIKLSSFDFDVIYAGVLKKYVYPLFMHVYKLTGDGWLNLSSQNFIVRYRSESNGHLGLHNDGSYLSLIVTLNDEFEGGGTYFPKFKKLIKPERPGCASVHPGLVGYLHGARPVISGNRYIIASFFFMGARPFSDGTY